MPRPLRVEYENAWYHVMNRGANRQAIYKNNSHRNLFYTILSEVAERFNMEIHAFCLMDNHYHLLVRTPYGNLARAMRHLDGVYTQRFNRLDVRDGPLFRGRYKAILIESDSYLLQVSRYIHLNPIEARLCKNPYDYIWSSYRSYVNEKLSIPWLKTCFTLNLISSVDLRLGYADFIMKGVDQKTRDFYNKKQLPSIFGDKKFIELHLEKIAPDMMESFLTDINRTKLIPRKECILDCVMRYFQQTPNDLYRSVQGKRNDGKLIAIHLLRDIGQISHKEIAHMLGNVKPRSISVLIARVKKRIKLENKLKKDVRAISEMIMRC